MATIKQIAANRRNAQKSTGPRTPQGKARSAQNARQHGLYSRTQPWFHEDDDALEALHQEYIEEWAPQSVTESHFVQELADAQWNLGRLRRIEARHIEHAAETLWRQPKTIGEQVSAAWRSDLKAMSHLQRQMGHYRRQFDRALANLLRLPRPAEKNTQTNPIPLPDPAPAPQLLPEPEPLPGAPPLAGL